MQGKLKSELEKTEIQDISKEINSTTLLGRIPTSNFHSAFVRIWYSLSTMSRSRRVMVILALACEDVAKALTQVMYRCLKRSRVSCQLVEVIDLLLGSTQHQPMPPGSR
jgi:hypothetical protein